MGVLIASHNRREATLSCLRSLAAQVVTDAEVNVYLVDDGSTDGTAEAVQREFPATRVLPGRGDLFWAGAMHLAERHALLDAPDFLLWLNDDVTLEADALARLLATHDELMTSGSAPTVIVGATRDSRGRTSYSGVQQTSALRRMRFTLQEPGDVPQRCATMNGNVVLIPVSAVERVGGIDERYRHAMADIDYGLRCAKSGIAVWLACGWVGRCEPNALEGTFLDPSLPAADRVRELRSQKGIPPREWLRLTRHHGGIAWPAVFISPYVRFIATLGRRGRGASRLTTQLTRCGLLGPARRLKWQWAKARGVARGSFSQDGEDRLLLEHFDIPPRGTYIDVGANHPWVLSNSYLLYRRGWSGVTVEPTDWLARLQRRHRPRDTCLSVACGPEPASLRFFLMEPHVLSTLSEAEMLRLVEQGSARLISEEQVPVVTISDITSSLLESPVDVLFTDTEDFEIEVLQGVDWVTGRPRIIVAEVASLTRNRRDEIVEFLAEKGYSYVVNHATMPSSRTPRPDRGEHRR